ncbi:MAG: undecaprenyl-diphosphate phosphatase [Bacilli bacterium]|nr:undecaprenyl-diphosphate phosphatase [Bacilli bacterium]
MDLLELFKYIILGFIQGITEPIPVSSSGHLLIVQNLISGFDSIDYELLATITNFGSFLAIVLIFKDQIISLFRDFFGYIKTKDKKYYSNYKYSWYVVIGTIPAGIMGLVVTKLGLFDFLESNVRFVGLTLLITAIFLFIIKDFKGVKDSKEITLKDAIIIGLFQVCALVPGISRSGSTIVGGMFRNLKRNVAFDFSFILYIPISIATMIIGVKGLFEADLNIIHFVYYFISMVMAFIFTYISTKWFKNVVRNGKLIYFVIYCIVIGSAIIIFF